MSNHPYRRFLFTICYCRTIDEGIRLCILRLPPLRGIHFSFYTQVTFQTQCFENTEFKHITKLDVFDIRTIHKLI